MKAIFVLRIMSLFQTQPLCAKREEHFNYPSPPPIIQIFLGLLDCAKCVIASCQETKGTVFLMERVGLLSNQNSQRCTKIE